MEKKYTERLLGYIFGEIFDYFEDRKLAFVQFKTSSSSLTFENLDQLSRLLKTDLVNFIGIAEQSGDVSWCPEPSKKATVRCWNAKILIENR